MSKEDNGLEALKKAMTSKPTMRLYTKENLLTLQEKILEKWEHGKKHTLTEENKWDENRVVSVNHIKTIFKDFINSK